MAATRVPASAAASAAGGRRGASLAVAMQYLPRSESAVFAPPTFRDARALFSSQGPAGTFHTHPLARVSAEECGAACAREDGGGAEPLECPAVGVAQAAPRLFHLGGCIAVGVIEAALGGVALLWWQQ